MRGVDPEFGEMRNIHPQPGGRFLNERDMAEKRRVVFLGEELARDLFGTEDVVGKTVQINQSTFLVVGVAQKKIQMGMYNGPDRNQASIPAPTFKSMYTDAKIDNLVYKPVSLELGDMAKAQVYRVMGAKYHFDPEDTRALGIWDTREMQRINDNIGLGHPDLPGDHRRAHPLRGRDGRRQHHVRGGEGEDARDRGEDGARGEGAAGDAALRARGAAHDRAGGHPRAPRSRWA